MLHCTGIARVGALTLLLALQSPAAAEAPPARPPPNVLLIVSDSLRADALSCYGGRARAPAICGLAERGVLFERAYSSAARTLPASVALFTGNHAAGYARVPRKADGAGGRGPYFYVLEDEELLAERLRERGYDVVADIENPVAEQSNNLQGFRRLPQPEGHARFAAASLLGVDTRDPRDWRSLSLARYLLAAAPRPFFALRWIEDPHAAYAPPERLQKRVPARTDLGRPVDFYAGLDSRALRKRAGAFTPEEVGVLNDLYIQEVESVDERVGHALGALERAGLRDETLVIFTADHGEGFGEHGRFQHGNSFYDELVRIPLIVAGPAIVGGRRLTVPVSHVDLAPTLAELVAIEGPEAAQGRSFAALLRGEPDPSARSSYIVDAFRWHKRDALVEGPYKLISWGGAIELYDLSRDPGEEHDLSGTKPEVVAQMLARMEAIRAENEARRRRRLAFDDGAVLEGTSQATQDQLRALGYID